MTITLYKYKYPFPDVWEEDISYYEYLKELEPIGLVDDFISCIFKRSWAGIGEWQIVMPIQSPHIQEFNEAQFIRIHSRAAGVINKAKVEINEQAQTVTFSGYELKGIYKQRISKGDPNYQLEYGVDYIKSLYGVLFTRCRVWPPAANYSGTEYDRWIPCEWGTDYTDRQSVSPVIKFTPPTDNYASIMQSLSETYDDGWMLEISNMSIQTAEHSKNMFAGQSDIQENGFCLNASGQPVSNDISIYTKCYAVEAGQEYYFYGTNSSEDVGEKRIHGYASESVDSWVAQLGLATNVAVNEPFEIHFTIPDGVNYIRCSFQEIDYQVMLELAPKTTYTDPYTYLYHEGEGITIVNSISPMDCTKDQDMTGLSKGMPLILSYDLNSVYSSSLEINKYQPNYAYVLGDGTGFDRQVKEVSSEDGKCLNRNEVIVDVRDVSDISYLTSKGMEYLAKYGSKFSYHFEASPYIIKRYPFSPNNSYLYQRNGRITIPEDKNVELGVYGTLVDENLGVEQDFEITAITEVYEADGFHLELELGYDNTSINGKFNISSAQIQSLVNSPLSQLGADENGHAYINNLLIIKSKYPNSAMLELNAKNSDNSYTSGYVHVNPNGIDRKLDLKIIDYSDNTEVGGRTLSLYSPQTVTSINDALQLTESGDSKIYKIIHSGNIGSYATSFQPSSVSGAITWDTTHVNTASGQTSYVIQKLGNIRLFRFKIVLKSALTATATIGTISSGNRPNTTIYGTACTLSSATNDVRVVGLNSSGGIVMWNNTKASTYYGTIVYFV